MKLLLLLLAKLEMECARGFSSLASKSNLKTADGMCRRIAQMRLTSLHFFCDLSKTSITATEKQRTIKLIIAFLCGKLCFT